MKQPEIYRIIDANANRCREALRVIEDYMRFCHEDARIAARLKRERHRIASNCDAILRENLKGLKARRIATDPGRDSRLASEVERREWLDVLLSNFRRAEESLRVLEEVTKLIKPALSRRFKNSRFRVYDLEKTCLISLSKKL